MHEMYHVTFFTKVGISVKARKFFGVLFTIIGAMTAFISVAVLILPLIANDQTRLVLESFYQASENPLVNLMNNIITFMMENGTLTLALGSGLLLTGILLLLSAARLEEEQAAKRRSAQRKTPVSSQAAPVWKNHAVNEEAGKKPFAEPAKGPARHNKPTVFPAPDRAQEAEASATARSAVSVPLSPTSPLASPTVSADHSSYQRPPEPEYSMPPDDQVTSFGTARKVSLTPAAAEPAVTAPAPAVQKEPEPTVTPLFSTGFHLQEKPAEVPGAQAEPEAAPQAKAPETAVPVAPAVSASNPAPKKSKVVIKSTMGKHSL